VNIVLRNHSLELAPRPVGQGRAPRAKTRWAWLLVMLLSLFLGSTATASLPPTIKAGEVPDLGVSERLGEIVPLDAMLVDEQGKAVRFGDLVDKPVLLLFVYYRCPSICNPLMRELANNLDHLEGLEAGEDFTVITISFDPNETPEIAANTKNEILGTMEHPPKPAGWRFLTGTEETVRMLTESMGFKYAYDPETQTYLHATSLIFLSREGKIVRYLGGLSFLPAEIKLALFDAYNNQPRAFMGTFERFCYGEEPAGRSFVKTVNRVILGATGVLVIGLSFFLVLRKRRKGEEDSPAKTDASKSGSDEECDSDPDGEGK